jgi:hypothetical protein
MLMPSVALLLALAPNVSPEGKEDEALARAFKEADVVFTARIGKVSPLGKTNSIPASVFGEVTFKEARALRGVLPEAAKFAYSHREGARNMDLKAEGPVLVAVKGKAVTAVVPATEDNVAFARKAFEAREK